MPSVAVAPLSFRSCFCWFQALPTLILGSGFHLPNSLSSHCPPLGIRVQFWLMPKPWLPLCAQSSPVGMHGRQGADLLNDTPGNSSLGGAEGTGGVVFHPKRTSTSGEIVASSDV